MTRKAYLEKYHSSEELKQKYLHSKDSVESRRWHLLWKISQGWTIKNSAIAVGINYDYGKEILKKYNNRGEKGVKNLKNKQRKQSGRKETSINGRTTSKITARIRVKSK